MGDKVEIKSRIYHFKLVQFADKQVIRPLHSRTSPVLNVRLYLWYSHSIVEVFTINWIPDEVSRLYVYIFVVAR
jgi:hypothetical protein